MRVTQAGGRILLAVLGKLSDTLIGVLERFLLKRWG